MKLQRTIVPEKILNKMFKTGKDAGKDYVALVAEGTWYNVKDKKLFDFFHEGEAITIEFEDFGGFLIVTKVVDGDEVQVGEKITSPFVSDREKQLGQAHGNARSNAVLIEIHNATVDNRPISEEAIKIWTEKLEKI